MRATDGSGIGMTEAVVKKICLGFTHTHNNQKSDRHIQTRFPSKSKDYSPYRY
jgi:hypothetical protein